MVRFHTFCIPVWQCQTAHISDNIDTRSALDAIRDLVSQSNIYIRDQSSKLNSLLLRKIAMYITDMLHIFGAINGPRGGIGFPIGGEASGDVRVRVKCVFMFDYRLSVNRFAFRSRKP